MLQRQIITIETWPGLALLFLLLFVYLVTTEIQSQDCEDRLCYNTTPSPQAGDSSYDMIDKMVTTLRVNHSPVEWRKALMIGLILSLVIICLFGSTMTIRNYVIIVLIIFLVVYFISTWTNWVYWRDVDTKIDRKLLRLRSHLNSS